MPSQLEHILFMYMTFLTYSFYSFLSILVSTIINSLSSHFTLEVCFSCSQRCDTVCNVVLREKMFVSQIEIHVHLSRINFLFYFTSLKIACSDTNNTLSKANPPRNIQSPVKNSHPPPLIFTYMTK